MKLRILKILILSVTFCCSWQTTSWAQETQEPAAAAAPESSPKPPSAESQSWPSFEKAFQAGVANYQSQKFEDARLAFTQAVEKEPKSVQALTNLALVQFQLGQKAWAVALLRKAHNLDPNFSTPKAALDFILPQLDVKEIPHEIQLWETIRSSFVVPYSLTGFLGMTALSLFAFGWLILKYFGQRREAFREEKALPSYPLIATLIGLVFLASLTVTTLKIWDGEIPRGTVVAEKVTVYSAPSDKSVALFDLFGGLEIIMNTADSDWVQVTYPGALTGWIPKSSVFQTSGRQQW